MALGSINSLLVVAGPRAAGKTTLSVMLQSGQAGLTNPLLAIEDPSSWKTKKMGKLRAYNETALKRIIVHAAFLRDDASMALAEVGVTRTSLAPIVMVAKEVSCLTLWCPAALLLERIEERIRLLEADDRYKPYELERRVYTSGEALARQYDAWFESVRDFHFTQHLIVDATDDALRVHGLDEWPRLRQALVDNMPTTLAV